MSFFERFAKQLQPEQGFRRKSQKNLIFLKSLGVEKMTTTIGGWELVCDIDWGFMLRGSDWFYGYFEVSNCRFIV